MRCRSASGIFQCNAVFNWRIWRFVHLTIRPLRSRWPDGITKFRSPAAPNYRKLPDSNSSGSGITPDTKAALRRAAATSGRSLSQEAEHRLRRGLDEEEAISKLLGDVKTSAMLRLAA